MPLPLPFDPDEDLPTLNQRIEWHEQGLLVELESLPHVTHTCRKESPRNNPAWL